MSGSKTHALAGIFSVPLQPVKPVYFWSDDHSTFRGVPQLKPVTAFDVQSEFLACSPLELLRELTLECLRLCWNVNNATPDTLPEIAAINMAGFVVANALRIKSDPGLFTE
jgi:hypothetical protein